jgi:hypothetical protein
MYQGHSIIYKRSTGVYSNWGKTICTSGTVIYNRSMVICSNWGKTICNSGTVIHNRSTVIYSKWGKGYVTAVQLYITGPC